MTTAGSIQMPGTSGNFIDTPDSVGLSPTAAVDLRVKVNMTDWTPTAAQVLIAKWGGAGGSSYRFYVDTAGKPTFTKTSNGSTSLSITCSAATGVADGTDKWVRVTHVTSSGQTIFYLSDDGSTWTQLGTTGTLAAGSSMFDSTTKVEVGSDTQGASNRFVGKVYYAEIRSSAGGTVVGQFDPTGVTILGVRNPTTYTDAESNVWTVHGTGWDWNAQTTYTGTGASTLPSLTQSGTGTFTKPTYTGTGASSLQPVTQQASGTFTKPVYTATAASVLPSLTQAAAGTVTAPVFTGTASSTVPPLTQTAAGTFTAPVYTASGASVLAPLTQAATGTVTAPTYTGTAGSSLPAVTQQAAGTTTPPTFTGTAASVLPSLTQAAAGTVTGAVTPRGPFYSTLTARQTTATITARQMTSTLTARQTTAQLTASRQATPALTASRQTSGELSD